MRWPESPGRRRAAHSGASPLPMRRLASIQCSSQLSQRGKAVRLPRVDLERSLELLDRAQHHPLLRVDAPQVHVREVPWLIARSRLGLPQPLDCLVQATLKTVGPAAERVCLGGGVERERLRVKLDRAIEVTTQVMLLPFHPQRQCLVLENTVIHGSLRYVALSD